MSCIAGVGGRVKPLLMKAQNAERILAIDGCPLNCVANTLRVAEVKQFEHLQLQELGFRKGDVAVTDQAIQRGVDAATEVLTRKPAASS